VFISINKNRKMRMRGKREEGILKRMILLKICIV
jgi:phage/plasmid-associated DNA primase